MTMCARFNNLILTIVKLVTTRAKPCLPHDQQLKLMESHKLQEIGENKW